VSVGVSYLRPFDERPHTGRNTRDDIAGVLVSYGTTQAVEYTLKLDFVKKTAQCTKPLAIINGEQPE
jgi:hypothetical protein